MRWGRMGTAIGNIENGYVEEASERTLKGA